MTQIIMLKDHVFSADGVHTVQFAARTKQDVSADLAQHWIDEGIAEIDVERVAEGTPRSPSPTPAEPATGPRTAPENQALQGAPETKAELTAKSTVPNLEAEAAARGVAVPAGAKKADLLVLLGLDGKAAELRDESTDDELRHELARRGVEAPEDATMADLQKLAGYTPTTAPAAAE